MKTKTLKRQQYKSKAFHRTASSYVGGLKMLKLLSRCEVSEDGEVSNVIANQDALFMLEHKFQNF